MAERHARNQEVLVALCCHPDLTERDDDGRVIAHRPKEDAMVAQLLALHHDEQGFRDTANISVYVDERNRRRHQALAA